MASIPSQAVNMLYSLRKFFIVKRSGMSHLQNLLPFQSSLLKPLCSFEFKGLRRIDKSFSALAVTFVRAASSNQGLKLMLG